MGRGVKGHSRGRARSSEHKRRGELRRGEERGCELQVKSSQSLSRLTPISRSSCHVSQDLKSLNLGDTTTQLGDMSSKEIHGTSEATAWMSQDLLIYTTLRHICVTAEFCCGRCFLRGWAGLLSVIYGTGKKTNKQIFNLKSQPQSKMSQFLCIL